jgi:hypothetical protein
MVIVGLRYAQHQATFLANLKNKTPQRRDAEAQRKNKKRANVLFKDSTEINKVNAVLCEPQRLSVEGFLKILYVSVYKDF